MLNEKDFLYEIFDRLGKGAKEFKDVYKYIRRRKSCPSGKSFLEGIDNIDKVLEDIFDRMQKIKQG